MSNLIGCDSCETTIYADSRAKDSGFHNMWIDQTTNFHLCPKCFDKMMRVIFHRRWNEDERQYVEDDDQ